MEDTLFIQFFDELAEHNLKSGTDRNWYSLHNGFSFVSDEANPVWVQIDKLSPYSRDVKLPYIAKKVYCSVFFWNEINVVMEWALQYPEIQFIIGGPAVYPFGCTFNMQPPKNVTIMRDLAETIFGREPSPKTWKINLPAFKKPLDIAYSFFISDNCYWGKCSFCRHQFYKGCVPKQRTYDLKTLENAPGGGVFLATDCLLPSDYYILEQLNYDDKFYKVFIKAGNVENLKMKEVFPNITNPKKLKFIIGVEFPSNKILSNINKGCTKEQLVDLINFISSCGSLVVLSYIIGWRDLEESDIEEASEFFSKISNMDTIRHRVHRRVYWQTDGFIPLRYVAAPWTHLGFVDTATEKVMCQSKKFIDLVRTQQNYYWSKTVNNYIQADPFHVTTTFEDRKKLAEDYIDTALFH